MGVLALSLSAFAAQADAHGIAHHWGRGFFGQNAIVTGTVTATGTSSFTANAYVLTPGAGGSSATPTTTTVTIAEGANTKIIVLGQSGIQTGDTFYATYAGQSSSTPIATLVAGDPSKIFAYAAPTPEVEVSGVITAAPTSADPDQLTATAYVVTPVHVGGPWRPIGGPVRPIAGPVLGGQVGGGQNGGAVQSGSGGQSGNWGGSYNYGNKVGGGYGFTGYSRQAHDAGSANQGTPNTTITVDVATTFTVNCNPHSTVSDLAAGQTFTATFDGTPSETLAQIVANPALSIVARTPHALYAFVGTVTGTDTTTTPETVSVNVSESTPTGLFTGTDTFDVGPNTFVFGGPNGSLFGSLGDLSVGDVVAGGLISQGGQTASAVESDPLQVLVDFPTSSSSSSSAAQVSHQRAADLRKALKLLGKHATTDKKHKKHHKKH
jgi:hypothetical protein